MAVFRLAKVIASLPGTLIRDTLYAVRAGAGFDLYLSDATGNVAHPLNVGGATEAFGHPARTEWGLMAPLGNGTVVSLIRLVAATAQGTATAVNWAATNYRTRLTQIEYLVTTAATTAVAGWRNNIAKWTVGAASAGQGGFRLVFRWGTSTGMTTATHRGFCGMRAAAAATDVNPSTLVNMVGMGWDSGDAQISIMYNNASGAAVKIPLGNDFPRPTTDRSDAYELELYSPPGTAQSVSYTVKNLINGALASGTITTELPANTLALAPAAHVSVGGTSSVIGISIMGVYIEKWY